jgi:hypothetical protein
MAYGATVPKFVRRLMRRRPDYHLTRAQRSPAKGHGVMRTIIAVMLSIALLSSVATARGAEARPAKKPRRHDDSYARKYPSATQRQLRNARAYDRGDYFEQDSNAHPVGSRGWWELKERESGDRIRF